jgi:hypothetical protein
MAVAIVFFGAFLQGSKKLLCIYIVLFIYFLYNYCHSKTRIVVERAFGILKNRWRILLRKVDQKSDSNIENVIVACMVLHNLLIELGDTVKVSGVDPDSSESQFQADFFSANEQHENHSRGKKKRDTIKHSCSLLNKDPKCIPQNTFI